MQFRVYLLRGSERNRICSFGPCRVSCEQLIHVGQTASAAGDAGGVILQRPHAGDAAAPGSDALSRGNGAGRCGDAGDMASDGRFADVAAIF